MKIVRSALICLAISLIVFGEQAVARNHALVIGINDYLASIENLPTLTYAVPDAVAVKEALEAKDFEVVILKDTDARRGAIIAQLAKYSRELKPEDTLLIYFAGHGVRQNFGNRSYSYWLTHDTALARLEVDAIRLNHLLDYVIDIPTRRRILVLDHCHSGDVNYQQAVAGAGRDGSGTLSITRNAFALDGFTTDIAAAVQEGIIILGAATDTAYEYSDLGHGVFTYTFLEALTTSKADTDNNGVLSTDELRLHVMERTRDIATAKNSVQSPIEFSSGAVTWEFAALDSSAVKELLAEIRPRLDVSVLLRCLDAIDAVDRGTASAEDDQLVEIMRQLATSAGSARSKAEALELVVTNP